MILRIKIKERYLWLIILFFLILSLSITTRKFSSSNLDTQILKQSIQQNKSIKCVMFTPKDNIKQAICDLIKNEQKRIRAAIYFLTDKIIALEFIQAKKRNVDIEIVTCASNLENEYNKIWMLYENGIDVYIFDSPKRISKKNKNNGNRLMHHKFITFEKNIEDKILLVNGSFNCTRAAQGNRENIVILEDRELFDQFNSEFEDIKKSSRALSNYLHKKPIIEKDEPADLNLQLAKKFWNIF